MSPDTFDRQIEVAHQRLEALARSAKDSADLKALVVETLEELSAALEELHVAAEELRQQNEELAATRQSVEAERQRYQDLFELAPDGYLVTDPEGIIREANRAAASLLGVRQEFLASKPLVVFVAEEARQAFHKRLTQMQQDATPAQDWQVSLQSREGEPFPASLTVAPVRDATGRLTGLRWLVRNISDRRRAEAALRVSEQKFAKAFRSSPDAITITTLTDGRYIEVNDSFLRFTGFEREEVIDRTSRELGIWPNTEDRDRLVRPLKGQGAIYNQELEFRGKSGQMIVGLVSAEVIDIGREPCFLTVIHDITDRKRAEKEREKLMQALQETLAKVKTLTGLLPICAWCKKIRDDKGYWTQVEQYIGKHSEALFSHGICPECAKKQYREALGGEDA